MANRASLIRAENPGYAVSRRGRHFLEFDLGGGKRRWVGTIEPLHIRDSETEIDATWATDTGAWQWKIAAKQVPAAPSDLAEPQSAGRGRNALRHRVEHQARDVARCRRREDVAHEALLGEEGVRAAVVEVSMGEKKGV